MQQQVQFADVHPGWCGGLEGQVDEFVLYTALALGVVAATTSTVRAAVARASGFDLREQLAVGLFAAALYAYVADVSLAGLAFVLGYCLLPIAAARFISRDPWFAEGFRRPTADLALAALLWTPVACHVTDRIAGRAFPEGPDLAFVALAFVMSLFIFLAVRGRNDLRLDLPEKAKKAAPYGVGLALAGVALAVAYHPIASSAPFSFCNSATEAVYLGAFPARALWLVAAALVAGLVFQSLVQSTLEQIAGPGFGASLTSAAAAGVHCALFFYDSIRADYVGGFFALGLVTAIWFHHSRSAAQPAVYGMGAAFFGLTLVVMALFLAGV